MKSERQIHGETVFGVDVDAQTRCAHWHGEFDIIAIKFKCCGRYFPCYECHAALETHQPEVWAEGEFDAPAILCGECGHQLTIDEYLACASICPQCESSFNPGCARHYYLYFERVSEPSV
jgi:uncharacterized CHY-type Zn-finger protein